MTYSNSELKILANGYSAPLIFFTMSDSLRFVVLFSRCLFFCQAQMMIVNPLATKGLVPGRGFHILATVFGPFDVGFVAQDAGAFLFDIRDGHEGADV